MPPPSSAPTNFAASGSCSAAKRSHSNAQRRAQPEHRRPGLRRQAQRLQSAFETGDITAETLLETLEARIEALNEDRSTPYAPSEL